MLRANFELGFPSLWVGILITTAAFAGPSFEGLGFLAGGSYPFSSAEGISGDGRVVVGRSESASGYEAFQWTRTGGMVGLGNLSGISFNSVSMSASYDGAVVVGSGTSTEGNEAIRWTDSGMFGLGDLPGGLFTSQAYAASHDGSVIVGYAHSDSGYEAFRWTAGDGMLGLADLPGGNTSSSAYDISADGSVIVGEGRSAGGAEAFRWTSAEGMIGLGRLPGDYEYSFARAVSADGQTIVGSNWSGSQQTGQAFRWTAADGMVGLGDLPGGNDSRALDVSENGGTIVGATRIDWVPMAIIWDEAHGMRPLREVLIDAYGLDLTGWHLEVATAISDDGQVIVGYGVNPQGHAEGWIATIPEPSTLLLVLAGWFSVLFRNPLSFQSTL